MEQLDRITPQPNESMTFARNVSYIVFTHDLDFSTLLATTKDKKPA